MEENNPEDVVAFDVPMFIRLLEFAREDATDDETLHKVTDKIIDMCKDGQVLDMDSYDEVTNIGSDAPTDGLNALDENVDPFWMTISGLNIK